METFAYKWFILYYFSISALFTIQGFIWLMNPGKVLAQTRAAFESNKAPQGVLKPIKYLFLFNLISLVLVFFPFSWKHGIYVSWVFVMIFLFGRFLLQWESFATFWKAHDSGLETFFRKTGASFVMMGFAIFAVLYYSI